CLDRLRLSRRAFAIQVAVYQLAFRDSRHLRLSEGHLSLLPRVVDQRTSPASFPALELGWKRRSADRRLVLYESSPCRTFCERTKRGWTGRRQEFSRGMEGA